MKGKRIWAVCLAVLGTAAALLGLTRLLWAGVPDAVVRALGAAVLVALPVFAYTTAKLFKKQK